MPHAIRITTDVNQKENPSTVPKPEPPALKDVLPERLDLVKEKLTEQLPEQARPMQEVAEHEDEQGNIIPAHMKGLYRFDEKDDKRVCLDEVEKKLADVKWYRVEYHKCRHSADGNNAPCDSWEVDAEEGDIPSNV